MNPCWKPVILLDRSLDTTRTDADHLSLNLGPDLVCLSFDFGMALGLVETSETHLNTVRKLLDVAFPTCLGDITIRPLTSHGLGTGAVNRWKYEACLGSSLWCHLFLLGEG